MINQILKPSDEHKFCESKHPFEPYNIEEAKVLIIGSIPPHRFSKPKNLLCGDVDWYYGSKDNSFWDILKESCCDSEIPLCTKENQQKFFRENEIGIFDMVQKCTRKNGCGSSDSDLYNIELINACEIIPKKKKPELKLFFTSVFVAGLFNQQTGVKINLKSREFQNITICDTKLKVIILYSPSRSWSRGLEEKIRNDENKNQIRIDQYKHICSLIYETAFCKVTYLQNYNAIFCQWKQFCKADDYRNPLEYGLKLINKKQATTWITDTTNGFENEAEDTAWLLENFMPKVIESSCDTIIFIIKKDSPLKDEIDGQAKALSQYFNVRQIEKLE